MSTARSFWTAIFTLALLGLLMANLAISLTALHVAEEMRDRINHPDNHFVKFK